MLQPKLSQQNDMSCKSIRDDRRRERRQQLCFLIPEATCPKLLFLFVTGSAAQFFPHTDSQ